MAVGDVEGSGSLHESAIRMIDLFVCQQDRPAEGGPAHEGSQAIHVELVEVSGQRILGQTDLAKHEPREETVGAA